MADEKKRSLVKTAIIIAVVIIVDVVGGLVIGAKVIIPMLYKDEGAPQIEETTDDDSKDKKGKDDEVIAAPIKKDLDPININPAKSNGEILSCSIVLEATDQLVIDEVTAQIYKVMDMLTGYLTKKTTEELNDPDNWELYKKEMMDLVNSTLTTGTINALYVPSRIISFP